MATIDSGMLNRTDNEAAPHTHLASGETGPTAPFTIVMWVTLLLGLVTFAGLAVTAHTLAYFPLDLSVARGVQAVPAAWFHSLTFGVSWPGYPPQVYVFVAVVGLSFYFSGRRREAVFFVAAAIGVATTSQVVKILVDRPRPSTSLIHVWNPALNGGHWSFPAGHVESYVVMLGFILYLACALWRPSIGRSLVAVAAVLLMALVGLSRIDSGEHWFSDVMGGNLLGLTWLAGTIYFYQRMSRVGYDDDAIRLVKRG